MGRCKHSSCAAAKRPKVVEACCHPGAHLLRLLQAGLDAAIGQLLADDSPCWEGEPAVTENRIVLLTGEAWT